MNTKPVSELVVGALAQDGTAFTVKLRPRGLLDRLKMKVGLLQKERQFLIRPLCITSLWRASCLLLKLNAGDKSLNDLQHVPQSEFLTAGFKSVKANAKLMARVLAIAVQNDGRPAQPELVRLFMRHLNAKELRAVFSMIIEKTDIAVFLATIISAAQLNILEKRDADAPNAGTNPQTQES